MKCHQVLTGACNTGDRTFAVGRVEGVPFTAYAAGCNVVILAQNFERVQVIPGVCHDNVQIACIDCSTDTGKIAAAYGKLVCIFEPSPVIGSDTAHKLDYQWVQTGIVEAACCINNIAWNLEGTKLITAGDVLQIWTLKNLQQAEDGISVMFDLGAASEDEVDGDDIGSWCCIWEMATAQPTQLLSFSPDGCLFATCAANDRLIKLWYDNSHLLSHPLSSSFAGGDNTSTQLQNRSVSYSYVYLPHPAAVTGFTWRSTSKYMPRGSVSNMLVSSCRDNICRVWVETVLPDDGLMAMSQIDPIAAQNPRFRTHRHKHKLMSRLKHIKACFGSRRNAKFAMDHSMSSIGATGSAAEQPLPTMPSSYSVHDFPSYGFHAMGVTPGFHFHLAASINAATDIPLVPSLAPNGPSTGSDETEHNFVLHWLNNKEMYFTQEAENILLEVSKRTLEKELATNADGDRHSELSDPYGSTSQSGAPTAKISTSSRPSSHIKGRSFDDDDHSQTGGGARSGAASYSHLPSSSHHVLSAATSSTSIATDVTTTTTTALGDSLDRRIESLLRSWNLSADMLFSVHPVDGSLLVWILDFLDDYPGSFRQTQVSFCARIPNALPLGDAMTMSPHLALYTTSSLSFVKQLVKMELAHEEEFRNIKAGMKSSGKSGISYTNVDDSDDNMSSSLLSSVVCMTTKHANGSLNLWHITVEEGSKFTQVLNILHQRRVCGHRFQLNSVNCHPELPLLLTTSHHNKQQGSVTPACSAPGTVPPDHTPLICVQDPSYKDWCSELLIWKVDTVGPLSKSGGVTEIARLNSPQPSAFSNAAWIPTLLPSYSLGNICNSPSACFVASDGERLRVYQAVLDGRALLAEMSMAERRTRRIIDESTMSLSTDSSLRDQPGQVNLGEVLNIVSEQSTARPGCVLQLAAIDDATHHSHSTQLLHVFQEGLVLGCDAPLRAGTTSGGEGQRESGGDSDDQQGGNPQRLMTEESFYVVRLEENSTGSVIHMWRVVLVTQKPGHMMMGSLEELDDQPDDVFGVSQGIDDSEQQGTAAGGASKFQDASPVVIKSNKVCCQKLPLPPGVAVVHATPSAGHLSSACIYPACRSPYLIATACSDNTVRFWQCSTVGDTVEWQEWRMVSKTRQSKISLPGVPLHVSCAYSGRIACAYLSPELSAVVNPWPDSSTASKFACKVAVFECESSGGSQWVMCDPITVEDVVSMDVKQLGTQLIDQTHVGKVVQSRSATTQLASAYSQGNLDSVPDRNSGTKLSSPAKPTSGDSRGDALKHVSNMLYVPSRSTLHSIKSQKYNKKGVNVKQRHPVQIDWVSREDGTFMLTVALGSKIFVFCDVTEETASQLESTSASCRIMLDDAGGATSVATPLSSNTPSLSRSATRPPLKKSFSIHQITLPGKQKYFEVTHVQLHTADNLAPLPMSVGWVREGLLVVGMDNEMHCYTQWTDSLSSSVEEHSKLLGFLQLKPPVPSNDPAHALLFEEGKVVVSSMQYITPEPYAVGLMEASQAACASLPLYHPRQLNELLNSGKIRRVKAILAHLLRYLTQLAQQSSGVAGGASNTLTSMDESKLGGRGWSRSRTLSVNAPHQSFSREGRGSLSFRPEDLDMAVLEVKSVPPMPLWMLLQADKEASLPQQETKEETYAELFGSSVAVVEDDDVLRLDDDDTERHQRRSSMSHESKGLAYFGPRQAQCLAAVLTHTQLPGLSSLDQMHLLALADTVASCNVDFADKFDINKAKEAMAKETYSRSPNDEPSMDALDDCGLRFLLAQRHHTYLFRCLPLGQRSGLQRKGVGCHNLAWAFHSESQEELLQFIPSVRQHTPRWSELRELGVGWWIRNNTVLSKLILMVAKSAFMQKKDPLDAAIYYLAMKKKSLVWGLFRSINDKRMTEFFASDFTQERWRKAALKNAFALMGKQRFEHAAAFFLLAGALKDAIEVVVTQLQDEQLAMVIIRLYEGELDSTPPALKSMLYTRVLGRDEEGQNEDVTKLHPDPFLRSMAYWVMKEYSASLQTLLNTDPMLATQHQAYDSSKASQHRSAITTADPSVFNFYIYLRTHPLLIRQCIANTAKDTGGLMASRLAVGAESLDKKSAYESSMTPLERCLYFTTAYAHLQVGCPMLALEVLSKLPDNVLDAFNNEHRVEDQLQSPAKEERPTLDLIHTGTLDAGLAGPPGDSASAFDWGMSSTGFGASLGGGRDDKDELDLDFTIENSDSEGEDKKEPSSPLQLPSRLPKRSEGDDSLAGGSSNTSSKRQLDVMAQQLKFIACLKIMMSELSTLGTDVSQVTTQPSAVGGTSTAAAAGSSASVSTSSCAASGSSLGGQLRRELHMWLERQVQALGEMCGYKPSVKMPEYDLLTGGGYMSAGGAEDTINTSQSPANEAAGAGVTSLQDILQREKQQFEEKIERAARRKRWLTGNQKLLHTLLGYCSLHGCSGGPLTLVRLELALLLQELQQDAAGRNMLLTPLPCPTTLPLLSAAVANNKTVVDDPIKQLQYLGADILSTVAEMRGVGVVGACSPPLLGKVSVLRNLAVALSSCIYQSLSDSETLHKKPSVLRCDSQTKSDPYSIQTATTVSSTDESLQITTQPSKWPGVTSLICLMSREKDEDTPKLSQLLCEGLVGTYLCLLAYGLVTCNTNILYRLVAHHFTEKEWALLFGGGVKRAMKVVPSIPPHVLQSQGSGIDNSGPTAASAASNLPGGEQLISTLSSLQKTRFKFNMKLLGQLGFQEARSQASDGDNKSAFREQFQSPQSSIVIYLLAKPRLPAECENIDYDSSESDEEEFLDEYEEEEDIFKEPKVLAENKEHSDHTSYSWCLLRLACVKRAQKIVKTFLEVPQLDIQELAVQSPLLHSVLCTLQSWSNELTADIEALQGPPPEYIPGCFAQTVPPNSQPISKYKALLELHNTPFARGQKGVSSIVRLWQYLVRQDTVQDVFVRYIFARKRPAPEPQPVAYEASDDGMSDSGDGIAPTEDGSEIGGSAQEHASDAGGVGDTSGKGGGGGGGPQDQGLPALEPVRIIHKEQDSIAAFCINRVNSGLMSIATVKEVQELDISLLLQHPSWLNNTTELDLLALNKDPDAVNTSNYLVVQCPADKELLEKNKAFGGDGSGGLGSSSSSLNFPVSGSGQQTGRGSNVLRELKGANFPGSNNQRFCQLVFERSKHYLRPIRSHKTEGARRMTAHPMLPIYLVGCQDGSVTVREWQHSGIVARPRPGGTFAKVTKLRFNQQGNKFGVMDADGNLSLYHLGLGTQVNKPFYNHHVHNKHGSDFAFVGSSSLLASCGQSSEHRNVAMWDTLLPPRKACVVSWLCHDSGAAALLYAPQHQVLLSAGKKGTICIFDVRQRTLRHRFQAHESAIKCMALDQSEEFFVTGAADGDIKVWGLSVHNLIYNLSGEHSRASLFKNLSQGVTQLHLDSQNRLFSCGADGSIKLRTFPERDLNLNLL